MSILTTDVFKTQGVPTHTYVSPSDGKLERALTNAMRSKGTVCLLTGPSKTGKTTLVANVCKDVGVNPLTIRCSHDLSAEGFWRKALEQIDFSRETSKSIQKGTEIEVGGEMGGKVGWGWLAQVTSKVSSKFAKKRSEEECRERILAEPSADQLMPVLKQLPYFLVVEDFHYLNPDTQKSVFQQWKVFVDNEVSVAVLGTTHRAADLAFANKDLVGRTYHLLLDTWRHEDLLRIATQGFAVLNVSLPHEVLEQIADESVGLPLLTQAICLDLAVSRGISQQSDASFQMLIKKTDVYPLLYEVAQRRFGQFDVVYKRIANGLRTRKKRKYNSYECLLLAFTVDRVVYQLDFPQLADRLTKLPNKPELHPPSGSLRSALTKLSQLQNKMGVSVLEWYPRDEKLYIVEPSFLFYLRWRTQRESLPSTADLARELVFFVHHDWKPEDLAWKAEDIKGLGDLKLSFLGWGENRAVGEKAKNAQQESHIIDAQVLDEKKDAE
jgi:hypothetical protein